MEDIFYNTSHQASYSGINALVKATGKPRKVVKEFLQDQEVYRQHRVPKRKFKRAITRVDGVAIQFQADLFDISKFSRYNKGFKWVVLVVDAFSRFVACEPAKNKSGPEIARALDTIFSRLREQGRLAPAATLHTDLGNEFFNSHANEVYTKHNITHYPVRAPIKSSFAEISGRYVMGRLYKVMQHKGKKVWIDELSAAVTAKNARKNPKTAGLAPDEIDISNQAKVHECLYPDGYKKEHPKLKIGDRVQVVKNRLPFAKSYSGYYSAKTYYITRIHQHSVPRYTIADEEDNVSISGTYYAEELLPMGRNSSFDIKQA